MSLKDAFSSCHQFIPLPPPWCKGVLYGKLFPPILKSLFHSLAPQDFWELRQLHTFLSHRYTSLMQSRLEASPILYTNSVSLLIFEIGTN